MPIASHSPSRPKSATSPAATAAPAAAPPTASPSAPCPSPPTLAPAQPWPPAAVRNLAYEAHAPSTSARSFAHSAFANRRASLAKNGPFLEREKLRQKRRSKRLARGAKMWRGCTGRNPPTSSDESDCWFRLCTSKTLPSTAARCCTAVVFPVPVSPTRSSGSERETPAATRSRVTSACRVRANRPTPLPDPGPAPPATSSDRPTRPIVAPVAVTSISGLRRSSMCRSRSVGSCHCAAMSEASSARGPARRTAATNVSSASATSSSLK
eukprot:scaffold1394_cov109-Isochrysis_galbana.AAC.32